MTKQMSRRSFVSGVALAGASFAFPNFAAAAPAMGFDEARHLLSRTSFGIMPSEVHKLESAPYETALDRILVSQPDATTALPSWIEASPAEAYQARATRAQEARQAKAEGKKPPPLRPGQDQFGELEQWWVDEMLVTPNPLVERMTLFWHNHFTSAVRKVRYASALYRQNALFRREALGNFATMLRQVARDPAMLIYLDGMKSVARQPNENFARELLELFTLREGNYTEADIKAAARAFTGWSVDLQTGQFVDRVALHDEGEKTFLGKTGNLSGDDILTILLAHPRTAETIVEKLWYEFVSLKPDADQVRQLASAFRANGYELKPLLRSLFMTATFRAPETRGALLKSPVELIVGTFRILGQPQSEKHELVRILRNLGQDPFDPPNVKGWAGGKTWITSRTLLLRQQNLRQMIEAAGARSTAMSDSATMIKALTHGQEKGATSSSPATKLPSILSGMGVDSSTLLQTLLPLPPLDTTISAGSPDRVVSAAMLDITYQLK